VASDSRRFAPPPNGSIVAEEGEEITVIGRCILIVAASALLGCATTSSPGTNTPQKSDGEGLSCERRVKVPAIPDEYTWVQAHYPGAEVTMQSLSDCGGSPTDLLHLRMGDGRALTIYFDISSFFGKNL